MLRTQRISKDGEAECDCTGSEDSLSNASFHTVLDYTNNNDDDSNNECPICLSTWDGQDICIPNTCTHKFCYQCLEKWRERNHTCPIDREPFQFIVVLPKKDTMQATLQNRTSTSFASDHNLCSMCRELTYSMICESCRLDESRRNRPPSPQPLRRSARLAAAQARRNNPPNI